MSISTEGRDQNAGRNNASKKKEKNKSKGKTSKAL